MNRLGLLALSAALISAAFLTNLPIYSNFDADTPGAPPGLGGPHQPSSLTVPTGATILVETASGGITTQPVILSEDDGEYTAVNYSFPYPPNQVIRMEATVSVSAFRNAYFMQTTSGIAVLARIHFSENGAIFANGGVLLGTYTPNTPFRLRIDNDMASYSYAVAVDDEMDGFVDELVHASLPFVNSGLTDVTGAIASINVVGTDPVSIAYDDVYIGVPETGTVYCNATPNSTGSAARIRALGSRSISDNDIVLWSYPVPNQPFVFFFGPDQWGAPFGNGTLCVSGTITRIQPPGMAVGNLAVRSVDLPAFGVVPGIANFQCWFRDPAAGGSNFNLSRAVTVPFIP